MSPDMNITMAEALRLTRAGRLTEATAVLQRGLASPRAPAPHDSTGARPLADVGHLRLPVSDNHPMRWPELPPAHAASARQGLLRDIQAALPGLPDSVSPARLPGAARSPNGGAPARAAAAPGGEIRHLTHTESAGSRGYDLYIPTSYAGEPVPLVVMLHGGKQNALDFAAGTRMNELAEQHTFLVAYPEQSSAANSGRLLELVLPVRPAGRCGRAGDHRRHHPPGHARSRRRPDPRLRRRVFRRWRHGRGHGRDLPRPLRGGRGALRDRLPRRTRRRLRLRGDANRRHARPNQCTSH